MGGHGGEGGDVLFAELELGNADRLQRVLVGHADEPVRLGIRQGAQEHGTDEAEDGGVGANTERQREDGDQREGGVLRRPRQA